MKRFLSILLAVVMILSLATPVFAARFSDVAESDYAKAIENLSGLGVINGYDDGTYLPEKVVTRAEMAKLLVTCLGLDMGASLLEGQTSFNDVPSTHWATGYIAVAVQYGLIKGDGDGNFRPDDTVNYAEAATMCLRALGYDRVIDKAGSWPTNYLNKAGELKLFAELTVQAGTVGASRETVAQMMWNMLQAPMWEIGSESENDGVTYGKGNTMLAVKFADFNHKVGTTTAPNYVEAGTVTKIEVIDATTIEATIGGVVLRFNDVSPLELVEDAKYDILYTVEKIDGVNKNVAASLYKDQSSIVFGYVEEATATEVTINGNTYEENAAGVLAATDEGSMAVIVLNTNGKVTEIRKYASTNEIVVNKITDSKDGKKTTYDVYAASDNAKIIIDNTDKDIMFVKYYADGSSEIIDQGDIEVGMIMEKYTNGSLSGLAGANETGDIYVITDEAVSGKISKITGTTLGTGATTDLVATIDGVEYRFEADALLLLASKTAPEDLTAALVNGLIGKTIEGLVNASGEIIYLEAEDSVTAKNYGFLLKGWADTVEGVATYKVRVMGLDGVSHDYETYDFKNKAPKKLGCIAADSGAIAAGEVGQFIEYELEDDKMVQTTSANVAGKANTALTARPASLINETAKTFTWNSEVIAWNSNTKAYQYEITAADFEVDTKSFDLKDLANSSNYIVIYDDTTNVAEYVLYSGSVATDKVYGIISEVSYIGGSENSSSIYGTKIYDIATGEEVELLVGKTPNALTKGTVVSYVEGTDGYYDLTDETSAKLGVGGASFDPASTTYVYDVGDNKAIVLDATTILTTGNAEVIFVDANGEVDETKDLSDMTASDEVYGVSYLEKVNSADAYVYDVIVVIAK